jgi:UPF0271 protein
MIVDMLLKTCGDTILFCMESSVTYDIARQSGLPVVREFYADRDYDNSGSIVFKRQVGRPHPAAIAEKCVKACKTGKVTTVEGDEIEIGFESICFHSDTPGALEMGKAIRAGLTGAGITIASAATVLEKAK